MKNENTSSFEIVPLNINDIDNAVELHMKAFPNFFLSFLGPKFLKEFYISFLKDRKGIGFVARQSRGDVKGIIVGPTDPNGYFKHLIKRRWWAFTLASVGALIRKPSIAIRLIRALRYSGDSPKGPTRALLSSIAVNPNVQSKGVGSALVKRWMMEVQQRGAIGCSLTTDAEGNETVNRFYHSLGWRIDSSFNTPEGRRMHCYVYDFKES